MKALLIDTLETLGYPVYLLGTIGEDEPFPPSFITFFTLDSPDNAHFDNAPASWAWRYQVTFYSSDPALVASVPDEIRKALRAVGFIPNGRGRDIPSDEPTHTGWTQEYYMIEYRKGI